MPDPISAVKNSIQQDLIHLNAVSQNLANANTQGYRSIETISQPFADMAKNSDAAGPHTGMITLVRHDAGELSNTGRSRDLAITGKSFSSIQTPEGPRLSRTGSFQLDKDGRLVNLQGLSVLGEGGEIFLDSTAVRIDSSGKIYQNDKLVDQLALVELSDPKQLYYIGAGLYTSPLEFQKTPESVSVKQGFLEMSNVNPSNEMVKLIQIQRHVESVQKALKTYGQMMDSGINNIGQR